MFDGILLNGIFEQIGALVAVAALCAIIARALRLPLVVGYLGAGVLLATFFRTNIDQNLVSGISHFGLTLLLFLVGLEIDWDRLRRQLASTFSISVMQLIGSTGLAVVLMLALGITLHTALYLGLALAFSSTVVAVKLLSEAHELNALNGRLSMSLLITQDLAAIVVVMLATGLSLGNSNLHIVFGLLLLKALAVILIAWSSSRLILPGLFQRIAKTPELLFLCSIAWCCVWTIGVRTLGLPMEVGALLAGLSLAPLSYTLDIVSRIRVLRDFFVVVLFVGLGSQVSLGSNLPLIGILLVIALIVRPLVTYLATAWQGYRSRTALSTALSQTPISEFSLILVGVGVANHTISSDLLGVVSTVMVVSTIAGTILFASRLHLANSLAPILKKLERGHHHPKMLVGDQHGLDELQNHIVIIGFHRMGSQILHHVLKRKQPVVVIDFNPDMIAQLRKQRIPAIYGDMNDEEVLHSAHLERASLVISTIPNPEETRFLLSQTRALHKTLQIVITAHSQEEAADFYARGADYVLLPHVLSGEHIGELIDLPTQNGRQQFMQKHSRSVTKLVEKVEKRLI